MNEAMGNAMIYNGIIVITIILISFFVGSLEYTKAYKVKNKIIEEIEKYGEASNTPGNAWNRTVQGNVEDWLNGDASQTGSTINANGIGYRKNTASGGNNITNCSNYVPTGGELANEQGAYKYCVFKLQDCNTDHDGNKQCSYYYRVTTFMFFDVPAVTDITGISITIPVTGETMSFKKLNY